MAITVQTQNPVARRTRRPQHTFRLLHRPYTIQPFLLAPVLPGETMKNLLLQSRAVTHPIKDPLSGWHLEYYIFYVKHRNTSQKDKLAAWILNPSEDMSSGEITTATREFGLYTPAGGFRWNYLCLRNVVEEYFRNEGEAWNLFLIDGMPVAKLNGNGWWESLRIASEISEGGDLPDDAANANMGDLDILQQQYEHLKAMQLTRMSYEDFLRSYGVKGRAAEDPTKPELLRYIREWSYPSNTIDPTNGTPRSAVSWSIAERADKDRYFSEPGFVFGVTLARPKVFLTHQFGSAAAMLNTPLRWLPAIMSDHPWVSLINQAASSGVAPTVAVDHLWDARDLFLYGDQYVNFDMAGTGLTAEGNSVALPQANGNMIYPTSGMVRELFVDETDASNAANFVRQDGVVSLSILGTQQDHT